MVFIATAVFEIDRVTLLLLSSSSGLALTGVFGDVNLELILKQSISRRQSIIKDH